MQYFVQGLTMGLAYVAPIGLQNLFVIHAVISNFVCGVILFLYGMKLLWQFFLMVV